MATELLNSSRDRPSSADMDLRMRNVIPKQGGFMKVTLTFLGLTGLMIMGFQNCQKAAYTSSSNSSLSKGTLVAAATNDPADGVVTSDGGSTSQELVSSGSSSQGLEVYGTAPCGNISDNQAGNSSNNHGNPHMTPPSSSSTGSEPVDTSRDGSGDNVCILAGPGKSVKLGIESGKLQGQNAIPNVLCMSANACLNIASKLFDVKGPEFRGYCKSPGGNPHVQHITDADLAAQVAVQLAAPGTSSASSNP